MLSFILRQQPGDSQLVLGVEALAGVDVGDASMIELDRRYGLLLEDEFPRLEDEMWSRVRASFRLSPQR